MSNSSSDFWTVVSAVAFVACAVFLAVCFWLGQSDAKRVTMTGSSRLARFEQQTPTYRFGYWLSDPYRGQLQSLDCPQDCHGQSQGILVPGPSR